MLSKSLTVTGTQTVDPASVSIAPILTIFVPVVGGGVTLFTLIVPLLCVIPTEVVEAVVVTEIGVGVLEKETVELVPAAPTKLKQT